MAVLESLSPISDHVPDIDVQLVDGAAQSCPLPRSMKVSIYSKKNFQKNAQMCI